LLQRTKIRVAGVDGTRNGWAVVVEGISDPVVRRLPALANLFDDTPFDMVTVDIPIGLLDAYEVGGRACDRAARKLLGLRGSSIFAAPVRVVLDASSWEEGCKLSRASSRCGKAISKQTYNILDKIREVDRLAEHFRNWTQS
jgi:predicted RNase H-like nuclease